MRSCRVDPFNVLIYADEQVYFSHLNFVFKTAGKSMSSRQKEVPIIHLVMDSSNKNKNNNNDTKETENESTPHEISDETGRAKL